MVTSEIEVSRDGQVLARMYPARWFWAGREDEPTTEVALRRGVGEDVYVVLAGYDAATQSATLKFHINPLVNWIWFGVGIMMIGTLIAYLPERAMAFATSKVPESAVTTGLALWLLTAATPAFAQHVAGEAKMTVLPRSAVERELHEHLVCMCGTCGRQRIGECTCSVAGQMRTEVSKLVSQGMSRDDVIQYFVGKYGSQEVLGAPIDEGFNRLAWALPYGAGLLGVALVGGIAVRWSRRRQADAPETATPLNPELEDRLDDELRELD
jgi:cytochrome c-type biogenesis protein CcmF